MNNNLLLRIAVFVLSTSQLLSPIFSSFNETQRQNNFDPPITPAGYTFGVWGVITLLSFFYGVYQVLPNRKSSGLHQQAGLALCVVYILFSVWLFAASRYWLWATVVVFVTMFLLLFMLFQFIKANKAQLTKTDKILLEGQVGIYLGWCTIAIFANTAAALAFYGIIKDGTIGILTQSVILVLALLNGMYGSYKTNGDYFLSVTIVWAFVGVFFGLRENDDTLILQSVVVCAILIFISFFVSTKLKLAKR